MKKPLLLELKKHRDAYVKKEALVKVPVQHKFLSVNYMPLPYKSSFSSIFSHLLF